MNKEAMGPNEMHPHVKIVNKYLSKYLFKCIY